MVPTFVSPEYLRESLGLAEISTELIEIASNANHEITLAVKAYTETTPVEEGSDTYTEIRRVGALYAKYLYFIATYQHEQANMLFTAYNEAIVILQTSLLIEPTTRQDPIAVEQTDIESERKVPYSQIGFGGSTEYLY